MSNEVMKVEGTVSIITAPKKEKNPKRVAQGKKQAEISKQAKARKKAEQENAEKVTPYIDGQSNVSNYSYLALAGLALTAIEAYYGYKTYYNSKEAVNKSKAPEDAKREDGNAFRLLDSLDL